jgi:hypothetical protein
MDATYRFRFLIYLAAFMLVMSLCFAYAEPAPVRNPFLFQLSPQHSGFLPPLPAEPNFDPSVLRATTPVISPLMLENLDKNHVRHRFFHRTRKSSPGFVLVNVPDESSVVVLTLQPTASTTR